MALSANEIIKNIETAQLKQDVTDFNVGDTIKVYAKIKEGNRERVQAFEGTTGSLFLCLFSFFLLPKGRDLPKHGLRGDLFRIRAGRQGRPRGPEGARRQDRLCGERCRVVRKAVARLVPLPVEREAACGVGSGGTGRLLRMDGKRRPAHAWRNGYCRMGRSSRRGCRPAVVCPLAERPER